MEHTVQEVQLKTGSRGLVIEVPGVKVTNIIIGFRAGFLYASRPYAELPHLLEHTVFGANAKYPNKIATWSAFEQNGAWVNAYTSEFLIRYEAESANFERERILGLFTNAITTPKFLPAEVETEKGNVHQELKERMSNHEIVVSDALIERMTARHSDQQGLKSLSKITPEIMHQFRRQTHTTDNLYFVIAGDLGNKQRLLKQLENEIAPLGRGQAYSIPEETIVGLSEPVLTQRKVPQIYYDFSQWFDPVPQDLWPVMTILKTILGGRFKSWIYGEARRRGLAYHVNVGYNLYPKNSVFGIDAFVTAQNAAPLFKLFAGKLHKAIAGKFADSEIAEAKQLVVGSRLRSSQTSASVAYWYARDYFLFGDKVGLFEYLEQINQVSRADLTKLARLIFAEPKWGVSFVGNISAAKSKQLHSILVGIWD